MTSSLPIDLRARLDAEPAEAVIAYLAGRLGCGRGAWTIELCVRDGEPVKTYRHHGPVGQGELERVAQPDAPPLG
jgi:hypothetical protein